MCRLAACQLYVMSFIQFKTNSLFFPIIIRLTLFLIDLPLRRQPLLQLCTYKQSSSLNLQISYQKLKKNASNRVCRQLIRTSSKSQPSQLPQNFLPCRHVLKNQPSFDLYFQPLLLLLWLILMTYKSAQVKQPVMLLYCFFCLHTQPTKNIIMN